MERSYRKTISSTGWSLKVPHISLEDFYLKSKSSSWQKSTETFTLSDWIVPRSTRNHNYLSVLGVSCFLVTLLSSTAWLSSSVQSHCLVCGGITPNLLMQTKSRLRAIAYSCQSLSESRDSLVLQGMRRRDLQKISPITLQMYCPCRVESY